VAAVDHRRRSPPALAAPPAAYIEESLADPGARVVDGYNNIMPAYELRPGEVDALVAYLRTLTE
jgi:hypothetical protein